MSKPAEYVATEALAAAITREQDEPVRTRVGPVVVEDVSANRIRFSVSGVLFVAAVASA